MKIIFKILVTDYIQYIKHRIRGNIFAVGVFHLLVLLNKVVPKNILRVYLQIGRSVCTLCESGNGTMDIQIKINSLGRFCK